MSTDRLQNRRMCTGSHVFWGNGTLQNAVVLETPGEVRQLMRVGAEDGIVELHNRLIPEVPMFVKASEIIAINPYMTLTDATD